jgi:hypothetical protein
MADLFQQQDLHELIEYADGPTVSIFLPTHRLAPESRQDPIRLKNQLDDAEERLAALGLRSPDIRDLLSPGWELIDEGWFWSHQSDGLALFLASGFARTYRLSVEFPELVIVADRFHIKPLFELLASDGRFYVLALSQKQVRLLHGSRQSVQQVELRQVPQGLADALKYDDLEAERVMHVRGRGGRAAPVVFHGHGIGAEVDKKLLERYVRDVDDGLHQILRSGNAPLVIAGVGYLAAMFRHVTRYPHLAEGGIDGNPDELRLEELHDRAWEIVAPIFDQGRTDAASRYMEAASKGLNAAAEVDEVVRAAMQGRVEMLFVPVQEQRWGMFDQRSDDVVVHPEYRPGDEDLLDRAAVQTLLSSGTVFAVPPEEVPGPGPAAALLRY